MDVLDQPAGAQEDVGMSSVEQPVRDERRGATASNGFSMLWLLNMMITYVSATVLMRQLLGAPGLVEQWRYELQVPQSYHVIMSVTFGTALCLDLLAAVFWCKSSRLEFTLLPAWIKGAPFVSSLLMALGQNVLALRSDGKVVNLQRYICWMHTTPAVLYLIKRVSVSITTKQMWKIILLHEVQLGLGAVAKLSGGVTEAVLGAAVHLALVPVLLFLHKGLKDLGNYYSKNIARFVYVFTLVTYASFGVVWDLDAFNLVSAADEEAGYLLAELASKVLFSSVLMFSCFKTSELQRISVMRSIEEASQHKLIEELQVLVQQKDQFMSSVSHELRTPLNGIIGLSEAALFNSDAANSPPPPEPAAAGVLAPATRNQFQLIRSSGLRLLHLVNDILDATALQHTGLVLNKQRVFLKPLCEEVADITRATLKPGVVLHCHVPHDLEVLGDQDRIVQVLNNLVRNAVKFTPSGSITISAHRAIQQVPAPHSSSRISSSDHQLGQFVSVSVTDTGYGIPADKLKSIFLPFEQVHVQASRSQRGLGLGLSIVHKLVTAMGGTVCISSQEGRGSTLTFSLPAYSAQDELSAAIAGPGGQGVAAYPVGFQGGGHSSRVSFNLPRTAQLPQIDADDSTAQPCSGPAATCAPAGAARLVQVAGVGGLGNIEVAEFKPGGDIAACWGPGGVADVFNEGAAVGCMAEQITAVAHAGHNGSSGHQQVLAQRSSQPARHDDDDDDGDDDDDDDDDDDNSDDWPMVRAFDPTNTGYAALAAVGENTSGAAVDSTQAVGVSVGSAGGIAAQRFYSEVNQGCLQLLVVDDDDTNHQVMSLLLESAGHTLLHTHSGSETLKYLMNCQLLPDVILLDAAMPGMDGREVCRRIRSMMSASRVHLPIVMVTAQVSAYAVDASAAAGADDHLGKPFSRNELLQSVLKNFAKQKRAPEPA